MLNYFILENIISTLVEPKDQAKEVKPSRTNEVHTIF